MAITAFSANEQVTMDNFNSRITEANNDINAVNNKTQQNTAEISQLREQIGDLGGFYAGNSAPSKTNLLWIDTGNNNLLKYYNGSAWTPISAAWG